MLAQNDISTARLVPKDGKYVVGSYVVRKEQLRNFSNKYDFATQPNCFDITHDAAQAIDGTAGDYAVHQYADGLRLIWYSIGAGQAIHKPSALDTGMNYGFDQTDNDGFELVTQLNASTIAEKGIEGVTKFTVGKSAFYGKLRFSIEDVSGTDDCAFGFCKVEDHNAAIDDKDEMACLNVISGNITIETILNGGDTVSTDTTDDWTDEETHTLEVYVSKAGVVTYKIDGVAPTTTKAYSFDTNEVVMPFFYMINASDKVGALTLQEFEYGLQ